MNNNKSFINNEKRTDVGTSISGWGQDLIKTIGVIIIGAAATGT
ncbi:hypothetical protein [Lentibacillus amyloliquefaciens]|nr:hypothetical protein [Lentibacillus amyloliquefaciens]